jgi:outer membrane immunogenic protein
MRSLLMKSVAVGALAAALSAGSAAAADLPVAAPVEPVFVPPVVYSWSGFYIGAHAGFAWGDHDDDDDFFDDDNGLFDLFDDDDDEDDDTSFVGGGQIGYNWQAGAIVFGAEADLSWTNIENEHGFLFDEFDVTGLFLGSGVSSFSAEIDWLGTVRGTLGVAFDRFMIYATGGLAFANIVAEYSETFDPGAPGGPLTTLRASEDDTVWGWALGFGAQAMITPNLVAGIKYLYLSFDDDDFEFTRNGLTFSQDVNFDVHVVRGELNWKVNLF